MDPEMEEVTNMSVTFHCMVNDFCTWRFKTAGLPPLRSGCEVGLAGPGSRQPRLQSPEGDGPGSASRRPSHSCPQGLSGHGADPALRRKVGEPPRPSFSELFWKGWCGGSADPSAVGGEREGDVPGGR